MTRFAGIIKDIWYSHQGYLGERSAAPEKLQFEEMIGRFFCPGPFYYYVIDSPTLTFDFVSSSVKTIFGKEPQELTLQDMLEEVHPDDINFMARCEDIVADFIRNKIPPEQITNYKITYSLRERTASGEYRLFLMQTVTLRTTEDGSLLKVFGLHTDISHISSVNNHKLSLIGLNGQPSYLAMDVMDMDMIHYKETFNPLTKREHQIIKLFGEGLSAKQIAESLCISTETVISHKKNALARIGGKNITELVAICIRKGYI
jgi:Response regulator containing a CheY-like receiver domain and an HTH DNA-binding domain